MPSMSASMWTCRRLYTARHASSARLVVCGSGDCSTGASVHDRGANLRSCVDQSEQDGCAGRIAATNVPLKVLITNAYQLSFFQVVGGPDWVSTDRFDIAAKVPDGAPPEQTRAIRRSTRS